MGLYIAQGSEIQKFKWENLKFGIEKYIKDIAEGKAIAKYKGYENKIDSRYFSDENTLEFTVNGNALYMIEFPARFTNSNACHVWRVILNEDLVWEKHAVYWREKEIGETSEIKEFMIFKNKLKELRLNFLRKNKKYIKAEMNKQIFYAKLEELNANTFLIENEKLQLNKIFGEVFKKGESKDE